MADFGYIFGRSVPYEMLGNASLVAREERIGWVVLTNQPATIHAIGAIMVLWVSSALATDNERFAARQGWLSARELNGRKNVA